MTQDDPSSEKISPLGPKTQKPTGRTANIPSKQRLTVFKNNCPMNRYTSKYTFDSKGYGISTVFKTVESVVVPANILSRQKLITVVLNKNRCSCMYIVILRA